MCRRYSLVVEVIRDLAERPSGITFASDEVDEVRREDLRPSSLGWRYPCASRPATFGDQPFELVDRDESRSPGHLDSLDQRQDAAVERRAAHSERSGRLCARVGEPLDTRCLSNDFDRCRGWIGSCVSARFLASASQATARHSYSVQKC